MNKVFFDSNIWIYFFEQEDNAKFLKVDELLQNNDIFLSTQVVNEVAKNLLYKYDFTNQDIKSLIAYFFSDYEVISLDFDVLNLAIRVRDSFPEFNQVRSYWDGNIIATAMISGSKIVYSEDWQHNRDYQIDEYQIKIINPFVL